MVIRDPQFTYVLGVPVPAHNEFITKMIKKGVVVSNFDAVSGGNVHGSDV